MVIVCFLFVERLLIIELERIFDVLNMLIIYKTKYRLKLNNILIFKLNLIRSHRESTTNEAYLDHCKRYKSLDISLANWYAPCNTVSTQDNLEHCRSMNL